MHRRCAIGYGVGIDDGADINVERLDIKCAPECISIEGAPRRISSTRSASRDGLRQGGHRIQLTSWHA